MEHRLVLCAFLVVSACDVGTQNGLATRDTPGVDDASAGASGVASWRPEPAPSGGPDDAQPQAAQETMTSQTQRAASEQAGREAVVSGQAGTDVAPDGTMGDAGAQAAGAGDTMPADPGGFAGRGVAAGDGGGFAGSGGAGLGQKEGSAGSAGGTQAAAGSGGDGAADAGVAGGRARGGNAGARGSRHGD